MAALVLLIRKCRECNYNFRIKPWSLSHPSNLSVVLSAFWVPFSPPPGEDVTYACPLTSYSMASRSLINPLGSRFLTRSRYQHGAEKNCCAHLLQVQEGCREILSSVRRMRTKQGDQGYKSCMSEVGRSSKPAPIKLYTSSTRNLFYKGWPIRDGFWGLVKFFQILRDRD